MGMLRSFSVAVVVLSASRGYGGDADPRAKAAAPQPVAAKHVQLSTTDILAIREAAACQTVADLLRLKSDAQRHGGLAWWRPAVELLFVAVEGRDASGELLNQLRLRGVPVRPASHGYLDAQSRRVRDRRTGAYGTLISVGAIQVIDGARVRLTGVARGRISHGRWLGVHRVGAKWLLNQHLLKRDMLPLDERRDLLGLGRAPSPDAVQQRPLAKPKPPGRRPDEEDRVRVAAYLWMIGQMLPFEYKGRMLRDDIKVFFLVRKASPCFNELARMPVKDVSRSTGYGHSEAMDRETGEKGVILRVDSIKWLTDVHVEVKAVAWRGPAAAFGWRLELRRVGSAWLVGWWWPEWMS